MNSTRTGKIARLPKKIREELNNRLENGELGRTILDWINPLPDTQKILAQHFAGKTITHQNLSEWRRTGYQDWLLQQQRLDWFANLAEQDQELTDQDRCPDTFEAMGTFILFELGQSMTAMQHIKNPEARWTRLQNLTREFARLQNAYNRSRRVMLEWDQYNGRRHSGRKDLPPSPPQNSPPKNYNQPPAAQATKPEPPAATSGTRETPLQPATAPAAAQNAPQNPAVPPIPASTTATNEPPQSVHSNSHPDNALQAIPAPSTTTTEPRPYNPPLPQIQHQPPPPPAPKPYRPFSNPIRGRRFVCIEG